MAEDLGAIDGLDVCCKFLCEVRIGIRIITNEILVIYSQGMYRFNILITETKIYLGLRC